MRLIILSFFVFAFCGTQIEIANAKDFEDISILNTMMKPENDRIMAGLDLAEKLTFNDGKLYPVGNSISAEECKVLSKRVSQNYRLHSYEDLTNKGFVQMQGVKLCPTSGLHNNEYINSDSSQFHLFKGTVKNSLGVQATMVLSVGVVSWSYPGVTSVDQYLLNNKFQMVEYLNLKRDKGTPFWSNISTVSPEGNIVGKIKNVYSDATDATPYIWKGASRFVLGDGKGSGVRALQNDGKGVGGKEEMITVAYQSNSLKFEVSPLTDTEALYDTGNASSNRLSSVLYVNRYEKVGNSCSYGYIGYDKTGNSIRDFGDIQCGAKQDLTTTVR